jgi:sugar lactone lactonase YvrE
MNRRADQTWLRLGRPIARGMVLVLAVLVASPATAIYSKKVYNLPKGAAGEFNECVDGFWDDINDDLTSVDTAFESLEDCCGNSLSFCYLDCEHDHTCELACNQAWWNCSHFEKTKAADAVEPGYYENPTFSSLALDWCYLWGSDCGAPAAHSFCENANTFGWVAQGFAKAEDVPPTKVIGSGEICNSPYCDSFEYIQCIDSRQTYVAPTWGAYRVDWCKNFGTNCGQPAADQYCRMKNGSQHKSRWYAQSYQTQANVGPTIVLGDGRVCGDPGCDGFAEITCEYDPVMVGIFDDVDSDGWQDQSDNCPETPNPLQENRDGDGFGDECDFDPDQWPICMDGVDNDGDGLVDDADPGCFSELDSSEQSSALPCDDGIDNDADGLVDFPDDPGCATLLDDDEYTAPPLAQCSDGLDNDGDGQTDLADADCGSSSDDAEWHLEVGDLVVTDTQAVDGRGALFRVRPDGSHVTALAFGGLFRDPYGVALGPDGALYVSDPTANVVFRIDSDTGAKSVVASGDMMSDSRGIVVDADGDILVANQDVHGVVRVRLGTGNGEKEVVTRKGNIDHPDDLVLSADGTKLYLSEGAKTQDLLFEIDLSNPGNHSANAREIVNFRLQIGGDPAPFGVAVGRNGDLLVTELTSVQAYRIGLPIEGSAVAPGTGLLVGSFLTPTDLVEEPDGSLVVLDRGRRELHRLPPDDGTPLFLGSDPRFASPTLMIRIEEACSNGFDDDGDGLVDFPDDPGCNDAADNSEAKGKKKRRSRKER